MAAVADTAAETELHLLPGPDTASPSSRAVSWAWEAILRHGQPSTGHHIHIPLTQRQLAEAHHCSAGTIAWYLRCLGPAVARSDGAVVFDRRALAQMEADAAAPEVTSRCEAVAEQLADAFGRPSADGTRLELMVVGEGRPRPASLADMARHLGLTRSSTHRHLRALERAGRFGRCGRVHFAVADGPLPLTAPGSDDGRPAVPADHLVAGDLEDRGLALLERLAELMGDLTRLAKAVLAPAARPPTAQPARDVSAQSALGDQLRAVPVASRGPGSSLADLTENEISSGQSTQHQDPRKQVPVRADQPRIAPTWIADELPEILAPLLAACQERGLPGVTDPAGLADSLTPYSTAQIGAAAQRVVADLAGGAPMRSPVAILVAKARVADPYYFPPERRKGSTPPPVVEEVAVVGGTTSALVDKAGADDEAARAVASLSAPELDRLDSLIRERFPKALSRVGEGRRRAHDREMWRRIVWRQCAAEAR